MQRPFWRAPSSLRYSTKPSPSPTCFFSRKCSLIALALFILTLILAVVLLVQPHHNIRLDASNEKQQTSKRRPEDINLPPEHLKDIPTTFLSSEDMERWKKYASFHKCQANDEHYLQIQRDLYPFGIPQHVKQRVPQEFWQKDPGFARGKGITQKMVERAYVHLPDVVKYYIENDVVRSVTKPEDDKWLRRSNYGQLLYILIGKAHDAGVRVPNVELIANMLDEPRVLFDTVNAKNRDFEYEETGTLKNDDAIDGETRIDPNDAGDSASLVAAIRKPQKYFSAPMTSTPKEGFGTLLEMMCGDKEFVAAARKHSSVFSPSSSSLIHRRVPVFSRTKLMNCMGDILIPDYLVPDWQPITTLANNEKPETQWHLKKDKLYWRGSGSGGNLKPHTWRYHHRYDAGIVAVRNCAGYACQEMRKIIPKTEPQPFTELWKYKYVLDMDGHSYSGRFKNLLLSNSLVFKMNTLFPEFWNDWLEPWKHYIPVDFINYKTHDTFLDDLNSKIEWAKANDAEAQKIAEESTKRMQEVMRVDDIYCYAYRLLLEYATRLDYTPTYKNES